MKNFFILLRPQQWVKNLFILLPLFFDRHLFDLSYIIPAFVAFGSFCFASSSIYCLNDILDVDADRRHPVKCNRPIANGSVSKVGAFIAMLCCIVMAFLFAILGGSFAENKNALLVVVSVQIIMNVAYCIGLKHKAIVDVFIISIGFVLRIVAGGIATGVWLSHWIILMTFLLALFLAFAKRRDDVVIFEESGVKSRRNVERYNLMFLNAALSVVASVTMVCYILYSVSPEVCERFGSQYVYLTSVFVLAGIIRYLQVTHVDQKSGSPTEILLKDHFIQACIFGWLLLFGAIIYL